MVADPRAAGSAGRLRPLNRPRQVRVEADQERPLAVHLSNRRVTIEEIVEIWRIDDEWWREHPISRMYYRLLLEDGRTMDVFQDLTNGRWAKQQY